MTRETITASVVPLLIQIFYAEATADLMIDALNLFCKLLDKVGPEPVKRLFVPEFNKLCNHDVAQIRQVCAQNFPFGKMADCFINSTRLFFQMAHARGQEHRERAQPRKTFMLTNIK